MEQLVENIFQSIQGVSSPELNQYFIDAANDPELGPSIVQILTSEEEFASNLSFINFILGLLKTWFFIHYDEMEIEAKQLIFNSLHVLTKKEYSKTLSPEYRKKVDATQIYAGALISLIEKETRNREIYENNVFEYFNKINICCAEGSIENAVVFAALAYAILKKYKVKDGEGAFLEPSLVTKRFIAAVGPAFGEDLLKTTKE